MFRKPFKSGESKHLIIQVLDHNRDYNGICTNPVMQQCGAKEDFRLQFCAAGQPRCFLSSLFGAEEFIYRNREVQFKENAIDFPRVDPDTVIAFWTGPVAEKGRFVGVYKVAEQRRSFRMPDVAEIHGDRANSFYLPNRIDLRPYRHILLDTMASDGIGRMSYVTHEVMLLLLKRMAVDIQHVLEESPANARATRETLEKLQKLTEAFESNIDAARSEEPWKGALKAISVRLPEGPAPVKEEPRTGAEKPAHAQVTRAVRVQAPAPAWRSPTVDEIVREVNGGDYIFDRDTVLRLHVSLQRKRFAILTGPSGVGKTALARLYADAIGARFYRQAVRPNYASHEDLIGYYDVLTQRFIPQRFAEALKEANESLETHTPVVVCLDEINLARPEYYMADFLSAMEMDRDEARVIDIHSHDPVQAGFPSRLRLPRNFLVIGTANMDETTHQLADKVLDRINLIKLDQVNLDELARKLKLSSPGATSQEIRAGVTDFVFNHLRKIYRILRGGEIVMGYRAARDILEWVLTAAESAMPVPAALDYQIEQKILTRLRVFRDADRRVEMLEDLVKYLGTEAAEKDQTDPFPRSHRFVQALKDRLEELDFASGQE